MTMYEILRLLQGGVVNQDPEVQDMLRTNKFYFIPVVNPDGVALIEDSKSSNIKIPDIRKNMNPVGENKCNPEN